MFYFSNPLTLIALVGIIIPIVIHLVKLRQYKKVYFSNTDLLAVMESEQRNHSRLREWLILAARVLAIVFIVSAFAQPKIRHSSQPVTTGRTSVSIYLDNSFSMGSEGAEGILLEQAKHKARQIVTAYPPETRFQLITNDNNSQRRHPMTREEFLAAVDEVQNSPQSLTIAEAMLRQQDFCNISSSSNTQAYIISDFQISSCNWDHIKEVAAKSLPATSDKSKKQSQTHFSFVPLSAINQGNLFIDSLWITSPLTHSGTDVKLNVSLRNTGDKRVETLPVRLYLGGEQKSLATVDIDGMSQAEISLSFSVKEVGAINGYVEITDYPITFDDRLFFSINVQPKQHVLALYGRSPNTYIARLFDSDSSTDYISTPISSADFSMLDNANLTTLTSIQSLQSGTAQRLVNYVSDGGTLMIAPPVDCDIESYNSLLTQLGGPLIDRFDTTACVCSSLNDAAPIYRQVFRRFDSNVELPSLQGHFTVHSVQGSAYEPILNLTNGLPYLLAIPHVNGVVYFFTAPLDTKYSDFVNQALFVPTVYNMALYSRHPTDLYYTLGKTQMATIDNLDAATNVFLTKFGNTESMVAEVRHNGEHTQLLVSDMPLDAGNYILTDGSNEVAISFNFPREESLMQFNGSKEILSAIKSMSTDNIDIFNNSSKPLDEQIRQRSGGKSVEQWFIIATLIALLCEVLLLRIPLKLCRKSTNKTT